MLREGGYEGDSGMAEYRHPAVFQSGVEGRISELVHGLVKEVDSGDAGVVKTPRQLAAL